MVIWSKHGLFMGLIGKHFNIKHLWNALWAPSKSYSISEFTSVKLVEFLYFFVQKAKFGSQDIGLQFFY